MADLEFSDPPPAVVGGKLGQGRIQRTLEALKKHPDRWARVSTTRTYQASAYNKRHPDFEFTSRVETNGSGERVVNLYARYKGEAE